MVTKRKAALISFWLLFSLTFTFSAQPVQSQTITYHIEHQYVKLWVNVDGSIDLRYDIDIAVDSGRISSDIFVGMPNQDFTLGEAVDQNGNPLQITKDFEEGPAIDVHLSTPINTGGRQQFNVTANVQKMVYLDTTNPGNVGLQFIPTWWDGTIRELRVLIVLPDGATSGNVKNQPDYDNLFPDPETGRLTLYWERFNLAPQQQFTVGVSFPKELVQQYQTQRTGIEAFIYDILLPNIPSILILIVVIAVIVVAFRRARKLNYSKPTMKIESLGISRGLTAVEAAWLLGLGPMKIVVAILYSLLQKRAVWVTESEPKLKLEVMPEFKDPRSVKDSALRYYEYRFLDAIKPDGTLDESGLAQSVGMVRDTVEQKMRGYNRQENIQYYRDIADKAWKQVEGAETPELASQAFDENLLWLYMDDKFGSRVKDTLGNRVFVPDPTWWWFWWWASPTRTPPILGPTGGAPTPQPLPGGEFADKIVTSLEKSANGLVANMEKFADSIAPAKAAPSQSPARRGSGGSCACASCACACACVSCACACAGGRVR